MNDQQNTPPAGSDHRLTIGILSVTATVLLVGVLVVTTLNRSAMAIGQIDRGGDYIMVTMQFNTNTENVVITDAAAEKTIVYGLNITNYRVDPWSEFDLKRLKTVRGPNGPRPPERGVQPGRGVRNP